MSENYAVFVYGSLMAQEELDSMFSSYKTEKVYLYDFVRDYSEGAVVSWGNEDSVTGVLGIQPQRGEWCWSARQKYF